MNKPKMIENEKDFRCSNGHKEPVVTIALNPQLKRDQRLLCIECVENSFIDGKSIGLKKIIEQMEKNQVKKNENVEKIIMVQIKLIESLYGIVDQMKQRVIQQLDLSINIIKEWIQNLQQQRQQQPQYSFFEELETMYFKQTSSYSNQLTLIEKINLCQTSKLNPKLEQFNQFEEYNKCKELLELSSSNLNQIKQQSPSQTHQSNLKQFTDELNEECTLPCNDSCYAIAINKDCSELVTGSEQKINVYEFKQGVLKLFQSLYEHQNRVNILKFMNKSNQLISGSVDSSIIIWQKGSNNQFFLKQKLNGHSSNIYCLVLNNNENIIVSGSSDKCIKFWMKNNEWSCQETITDHSNSVLGLSLNQQQNKLVSCGEDGLILIIEQSEQNKKWIVKQRIKVQLYGFRICFIDNNMFIFSPFNSEKMYVYEMNQQFNKTKEIQVKCGTDGWCLFPQQYINSKCTLVSKNGEYVNFIKKQQNGDFLTEYSIQFGTCTLFGVMSDDGQYLITWDNKSRQIQTRTMKYI